MNEHNEPTTLERNTQKAAILFLWLSHYQRFKILSSWSWVYRLAKDKNASDSRMIPKLNTLLLKMSLEDRNKACKANPSVAKWCASHIVESKPKSKAELKLTTPEIKVDQTKRRPDENYEYMPASIDSLLKGYSIGIKYERNPRYSITPKQGGYVVRAKDRTLYFSRSFDYSKKRLTAVDLDEIIDCDLFANKEILGRMGYNFAMVNAHAMSKKYGHLDYDAERTKWWPTIVADSGGFQLAMGVLDFLDPIHVIEKHNMICDVGITLDVPVFLHMHKYFLARAAKVQKMNTDVLIRNKRPSLEILNVTHGSTFYLREKFREIVERDDLDRIALGGMKSLEPLPMALTLLQGILSGRKYKHYHALGVSGLSKWVVLAYIGAKNLGTVITSDSSSYIQVGLRCQYDLPHPLAKNVDFRGEATNIHAFLPCSCTFCNAARYSDVMMNTANTMGSSICVFHNLVVAKRYVEEITQLAKGTKAEIVSYLRPNFNPEKLRQLNLCLTAIDMAIQENPEKAARRFYPALLDKFPREGSQGLFSMNSNNPQTAKASHARLDKVMTKYEAYHRERKGQ